MVRKRGCFKKWSAKDSLGKQKWLILWAWNQFQWMNGWMEKHWESRISSKGSNWFHHKESTPLSCLLIGDLDGEIFFTLRKNYSFKNCSGKVLWGIKKGSSWGWESIPKRINSEALGIKNQFHRLELIPSKETDSSESLAKSDETFSDD